MCLLVPSLSWNWDASLIHKTVSNKILKTTNKCEDNLLKIDNKFINGKSLYYCNKMVFYN